MKAWRMPRPGVLGSGGARDGDKGVWGVQLKAYIRVVLRYRWGAHLLWANVAAELRGRASSRVWLPRLSLDSCFQ